MSNNIHFAVKLDTKAVEMNDGSKSVVLSFTDNETGQVDIYPLEISIAENIGLEMARLARVI